MKNRFSAGYSRQDNRQEYPGRGNKLTTKSNFSVVKDGVLRVFRKWSKGTWVQKSCACAVCRKEVELEQESKVRN
mgnify:CR=1 FL=1